MGLGILARARPDDAGRLRSRRWTGADAVLMGAVGDPSVPDHVSLWGLLLELRQRLDLWANLRPARLLEGIPGPLAGRGPGDVDMLFVRENTEGEYSGVGGRAHQGLPSEVGIETSVFTRAGVERVVRHAFELAEGRRGMVTSATKSNASRYGYVLWDEVAEDVAGGVPRRPLRAGARRRARGADGARPRQPRRRRRVEPLRRHPHRPGGCDPGRHGHGGEREPRAGIGACPACSSPCTARRRTSPGRGSRTRPARSGARR